MAQAVSDFGVLAAPGFVASEINCATISLLHFCSERFLHKFYNLIDVPKSSNLKRSYEIHVQS